MSTRPPSRSIPNPCGPRRRSPSEPTTATRSTSIPASQLGKESDINQGLSLGTVDMIISGPSFAARSYPPIGDRLLPLRLPRRRPPDRLREERRLQGAQRRLLGQDRAPDARPHLLRHPPHLHQQALQDLRRDEGPEDPGARRAGLSRHAALLRRQHLADRLRRGLSRAPERHRRRAGEPADHDRGQEVLRGPEEHRPHRPHRRPPRHHRLQAALGQALRRGQEDLRRRRPGSRRRAPRPRSRPRRRSWSRPSSRRA